MQLPLNMFNKNGLSLRTTFIKVKGIFEQLKKKFFIILMTDDINHAADNDTNPFKRLPVLVRILFKIFS